MAKESVITEAVVTRMVAQSQIAPLDYEMCGKIADEFGIPQRSVVASATRQGLPYAKKARVSKSGSAIISKTDLVGVIAKELDVKVELLDGLEKATKSALTAIAESFEIKAFQEADMD